MLGPVGGGAGGAAEGAGDKIAVLATGPVPQDAEVFERDSGVGALRTMKRSPSPRAALRSGSIVAAVLVAGIALLPPAGQASGSSSAGPSAHRSAAHGVGPLSTTTTTTTTTLDGTTTTTMGTTSASGGTSMHGSITAGPSRGQCISPQISVNQASLAFLDSYVKSFDALTGTTVTCVSTYLNNAQTWSQWDQPWVTHAINGLSTWVAEDPSVRQLVLEVDLIPQDLGNASDPLGWEQTCASGAYNGYATTLGKSLVAAGLGDSVIRLGAEMNGNWEPDFMGTTVTEQSLWAKCFDNEVTGLRKAAGQHFLIDWNVNACIGDYPLTHFYPGNRYVNIVGIDIYDIACMTPYTRVTFDHLANEQLGLSAVEAFAARVHKPMSLPEWGLAISPNGDDPGYISGIGAHFDSKDYAFESYFQSSGGTLDTLPLGPGTPLSVAAFKKWFGSSK